MPTIDEYITLSVTDCKRMGYFVNGALASGVVRWKQGGRLVASVGFATDTRGVPVARLSYNYNGQDVTDTIALRWKRSNLRADTEHGYYYFRCPVTGALCRKLYLVDGRFVGRRAFRSLYPQQAKSHTERDGYTSTLERLVRADELARQPYRREYYKGRLTPYGRKMQKLARLVENVTQETADVEQ